MYEMAKPSETAAEQVERLATELANAKHEIARLNARIAELEAGQTE